MWIEALHIDAFGGLRGFSMQLGPGLTAIVGPNESGKSTVMAFIRAMLYGLNGRSASLQLNDRKRCAPWDGAPMAGSLRLSDGKTVYEIRRSFGATKKGDSCRVVEADTGEVVPIPTGEEPGSVLLGVDEATFCDTLFLSWQGSRLTGDGAALGERIRNLAGTGREDVDLSQLLERLREARSAILPRTKDRGALAESEKLWMRREGKSWPPHSAPGALRSSRSWWRSCPRRKSTAAGSRRSGLRRRRCSTDSGGSTSLRRAWRRWRRGAVAGTAFALHFQCAWRWQAAWRGHWCIRFGCWRCCLRRGWPRRGCCGGGERREANLPDWPKSWSACGTEMRG